MNGKGVKIYVSLSQADAFRNTLIDAAKKTAEASGAETVSYTHLDVYKRQSFSVFLVGTPTL